MDARLPVVEEVPQVRLQQVPAEVVRLLAVLAVDDEPTNAARLEQRAEDFEIFEIGEDFLALVRRERVCLLVLDEAGVGRFLVEWVPGRLVRHDRHRTRRATPAQVGRVGPPSGRLPVE